MRHSSGIRHQNVPALAFNLLDDDRRFVFPGDRELSKDNIVDWIKKFLDGNLKPDGYCFLMYD